MPIALLLVFAAVLSGAGGGFELSGRIEPPRARVLVVLDGATSPYTAEGFTDAKGGFRFRGIAAGPYTLRVLLPGVNEVRRTVEVSASLANQNWRVEVTIPFDPTGPSREALERKHTVPARVLSLPESARREYAEAQVLLGKNDVAAAVKRLERAVEIAPQFSEAWNNLGTIAYHARQFPDAEKYFRSALKHEPGAFTPAVNLGGVLLNLTRFFEALDYNLYAVHQDSRDALANAQLGMNYFYLGKSDAALKFLKEAKRLDPSHFTNPQLFLAQLYLNRGDLAAAGAELDDFLQRHPDSKEAGAIRQRLAALRAQ